MIASCKVTPRYIIYVHFSHLLSQLVNVCISHTSYSQSLVVDEENVVEAISNLSSIVNMSNVEDQGSINFRVIVDLVMETSQLLANDTADTLDEEEEIQVSHLLSSFCFLREKSNLSRDSVHMKTRELI